MATSDPTNEGSSSAAPSRTAAPITHETYTHGHAAATLRQHGQRTAEEAAAFLLPELKVGMSLLDVGCGPGSITRGLAEHLAPGEVVGIELSKEALASAREDAAARGLGNLRYVEGSVYELPFADASFDVVFAHQVLQHLKEPSAAIREMLRVLRTGGWLAVRDVDWGTVAYWPPDPWLDRFLEVHVKTWSQNGGDPQMGRKLRAMMNASSVVDLRISVSQWSYAGYAETREWGEAYAERLLTSPMGSNAVERGNATQEDLQAMAAAFRSWAAHTDAFWAFIHVAALARKAG